MDSFGHSTIGGWYFDGVCGSRTLGFWLPVKPLLRAAPCPALGRDVNFALGDRDGAHLAGPVGTVRFLLGRDERLPE